MIGRKLGVLLEGTFASCAYLHRFGIPTTLDDLAGHRMVAFVSSKSRAVIPLEFQDGSVLRQITLPISVTVNAGESMSCFAMNGMGLIQVPRYRLAAQLASGDMVEILKAFPPTPTPVYLLYPEGGKQTARARVFIDWATALLSERLAEAASETVTTPRETIAT